jgi:hypothetical protein
LAVDAAVVAAVVAGGEFVVAADAVEVVVAAGDAADSGAVAAPHAVPVIKKNPSAVRKEFILTLPTTAERLVQSVCGDGCYVLPTRNTTRRIARTPMQVQRPNARDNHSDPR